MRVLISIVVATALCCLLGCAKQDEAPVDQPKPAAETEMDSQPIASEDFESGEADAVDVQVEDEEDGGDSDETP